MNAAGALATELVQTSDWASSPLGEIVDVLDSKRKPITKRDRVAGPYPYYGATGILDHVDGYIFDEPLVLIGEDGAKWGAGDNSAFAVEGKVWVNNHAHVLRPHRECLLDQWLIYYLNAADLSEFISGMTVPKLNQGRLKQIPIPLPPLEEQKRIVAVLDQAFAALDRARALAEANLADAEELYSPLSSKLFRQNDPPEHWQNYKLDEIAELRGGYAFKSSQYTEDGAFVLRTVNIRDDGKLVRGKDKFISESEASQFERFRLRSGDTLFVMVGATLGKTGFVQDSDIPALLNQNMWVVRPRDERIDGSFLNAIFKEITAEIVENSRGAARSFVKRDDVRKLELFLPPIEDQMTIMESVDAIRSQLAKLQKEYELKLAHLDGLRQSLLQKAFTGELT